ncbi:AF4/FMR2 family member 2 isoform X1 [Nerophis ophidion]|uniref:AF4/FMR2 family member 2 isoform X1 n=1 Tax=Nerophis ophidion TaxID=159077 RepID=UPI002ADF7D4C|nr:AF4/FMR2 family member 2 isoform X1 [Nerophis ophidion]
MDLFELDFFRDWELEQPCQLESERSILKRREWERRNQEVQQDEDLFSTGFNLFGEPYKTNKGDALASRVQNTLGSYEEMKDLLTSHSNQSHLVGIPKGSSVNNNMQTPTSSATTESQFFNESLNTGSEGGGTEGVGEKRLGSASLSSSKTMQPPTSTTVSSSSQSVPHQNSKKSRSSVEWSKVCQAQSSTTSLLLGLGPGQSQAPGAANGRGKTFEEQQIQRNDELFSSLKDELGLKRDLSPSSSSSSSSSSSASSGRRHSSHPSKALPLPDAGNYRSSAMDAGHSKTSGSPQENESSSHVSMSSSPLASTSLLSTTPVPGLTTPTATFPPGSLSGKPIAVQQKPTAYVRPMDGQDQAPIDSPQLKPLLVAPEGFNGGQTYGGNSGNMKNKLPKLSLNHTAEVSIPNDSSCVEEILREMTHSWPPPLTAIHTPGKADQTKFPIPSKESQHVTSGYNTKRCPVSSNKPAVKPPTAPQKSMLEDDLKISSDEEEAEQQVSGKPKARATALSGASGSSSESESSSESDTDESESSSSDSEYNQATRTNSPEPEPSSTDKWQLDSWLNKVQAQTKPLVAPQQDHHAAGSVTKIQEPFTQRSEAAGAGSAAKIKACVSINTTSLPTVPTAEHKDARGTFCPNKEKTKAKLSQKASAEGQRSKMRLSPGPMPGPEVATQRRTTTGKKQPRRTERSNSVEDNQSQTWSRANQQSPAARGKDLFPLSSLEHQNPPRPRTKPPSGKTAPRKEPRGATMPNNTVATPVALQQTTVPTPPVSVNQEKRKHRGPSSKITPKSREFVETDSSSSSSECQSDLEETIKNPALPPPSTRTAINTQTLSNSYTPPLPCFGMGGLGAFGGKGLCVRDSSNVTTTINSSTSSISSGGTGSGSSANTLSISNINASFGTSVPDPGGSSVPCKDLECVPPHLNIGQDLPISPLREYQQIQSLWVKIDLSLLDRVPGRGFGQISLVGMMERDRTEGRGCERPGEKAVVSDRERQKQGDREWQGPRQRQKLAKGEKLGEENEALVQDTERQGDRDRFTERNRQADREERERFNLGARDKATEGRREKLCQDLGFLDNHCVQEKSLPRLPGRTERGDSGGKHRRQATGNMVVLAEKHTSKSKRKHKSDHSEPSINSNKKLQLDKDCQLLPPCISPIHNHKNSSVEFLSRKQSWRHDEKLLPPLLSPLSEEPPHKKSCEGSSSLSQEGGATGTLPCPISSVHRHRRGESKALSHARNNAPSLTDNHIEKLCGDSCHANGQSESDAWSESLMEPAEPPRPRLSFSDTVRSADYYMQEAKRLKHKADALIDKFGKAVNYADGALSFIECGNAMERDPLEAKSPYTMYSETVELIRYAMRLKNFTSHSATIAEKKLAVLCNRCLSLLYLRMFHLKKDHAVKYSRSLMEYFKNSAKSSHQAPSPWRTNGKINGTPSPLSLSPSPANSGGAPVSSGSVTIPQRIHHMAASHVNITNNILRSYEHWEAADRLSTGSQEFFQELDSAMEPLTQQSSMTELVRYIRQGLHWLRIEAHLL